MKKNRLTRKKTIVLALMIIIMAGGLGVMSLINGIIISEKKDEKLLVQSRIEQVLASSKTVADDYVLTRKNERERAQKQLDNNAATLVGEIQVFMQSALIKKEAEISQANLKDVKRKREMLAAFALQSFSFMTKEMLRLKQDVSRMQVGIDDLVEDAQMKVKTESMVSGNSLDTTPPLTEILAQIKSKNIQNSRAFREQGSVNTKNEMLKLKELRKFLDDKKGQDKIDPLSFFVELSPDVANMLPENTIFTISEVGGKVLLSLGGSELGPNAITSEVSRPMIFQIMGESFQWIVKMELRTTAVAAEPNEAELADLLQTHILRVLGSTDYSGYVFGSDGELLHFFPENAGMKTSIPEKGWDEILAANISTFYKVKEYSIGNLSYGLGICYEMKHVSVQERISKIIEENPGNAVLLVILTLFTLVAIFAIGFLGWRGSDKDGHQGAGSESTDVDVRKIKPELGSLKRLQSMNRGHKAGGSRILDFTRNDALKELVSRVRGANSEVSKNVQQDIDQGTKKPAVGLREYMK